MTPATHNPTHDINDPANATTLVDIALTPADTKVTRKHVATAIAQHLDVDASYLGTPSLAFQIGTYTTLNRDWTISTTPQYADTIRAFLEDSPMVIVKDTGEGVPDSLAIKVARDVHTQVVFERLGNMVASKARLIERATGVHLHLDVSDSEVVVVRGEATELSPEVAGAITQLVLRMIEHAQTASRVSPRESAGGNDKYTMRTFLLRLGMIGAEYKDTRRILMKNLEGSAAWRTPPTNTNPEPEKPEPEQAPRGVEALLSRSTARPGARVRLISMDDPYTHLKPGDEGTVSFIDDMGTVHVDWDNGSGLGLVQGVDSYHVIA